MSWLNFDLNPISSIDRGIAPHTLSWPRSRSHVPPKIRELIADLEKAGFVDRGGKGSHRNFVHPKVPRPVTVSGRSGDDAKRYQIRAVEIAIEESKK
jgi:predicted RNA binding protein YcfA (HicA-like mRNA interferase family)